MLARHEERSPSEPERWGYGKKFANDALFTGHGVPIDINKHGRNSKKEVFP